MLHTTNKHRQGLGIRELVKHCHLEKASSFLVELRHIGELGASRKGVCTDKWSLHFCFSFQRMHRGPVQLFLRLWISCGILLSTASYLSFAFFNVVFPVKVLNSIFSEFKMPWMRTIWASIDLVGGCILGHSDPASFSSLSQA
jgi:hypothetical protein